MLSGFIFPYIALCCIYQRSIPLSKTSGPQRAGTSILSLTLPCFDPLASKSHRPFPFYDSVTGQLSAVLAASSHRPLTESGSAPQPSWSVSLGVGLCLFPCSCIQCERLPRRKQQRVSLYLYCQSPSLLWLLEDCRWENSSPSVSVGTVHTYQLCRSRSTKLRLKNAKNFFLNANIR